MTITLNTSNLDIITFSASDTLWTATETIYKSVVGFDLNLTENLFNNLSYIRSYNYNREKCAAHISLYEYRIEYKAGGWAQVTKYFEDDSGYIGIGLFSHF